MISLAPRVIAIAVFLSFIALGLAKAQSTSDNVDVCELQRNPSAYNHKLITVRFHLISRWRLKTSAWIRKTARERVGLDGFGWS